MWFGRNTLPAVTKLSREQGLPRESVRERKRERERERETLDYLDYSSSTIAAFYPIRYSPHSCTLPYLTLHKATLHIILCVPLVAYILPFHRVLFQLRY